MPRKQFRDKRVADRLALHLGRRPVADAQGHFRLRAAVKHVGDQRRRAERRPGDGRGEQLTRPEVAFDLLVHVMRAAVDREPHLPPVRLLGGDEAGLVAEAVHRQHMIAVRRPVAAVGASDTAMIQRPAPHEPETAVRMCDGVRPRPSSRRRRRIDVLRRMRMAGEAHRIFAPLEQREQRVAVDQPS